LKKTNIVILLSLFVASAAAVNVEIIRPDEVGAYDEWTNVNCPAGTLEYECVDEVIANVTDYVVSNGSIELTESFAMTNLSNATNVSSVTLYFYAKQYDVNHTAFAPFIRLGGQNAAKNTLETNSTWSLYSMAWTVNPFTRDPWTSNAVTALEAGMLSVPEKNGGVRVAQVYAEVVTN